MDFDSQELAALLRCGMTEDMAFDLRDEIMMRKVTATMVSEASYILRDGPKFIVYMKDLLGNWFKYRIWETPESAIVSAVLNRPVGSKLIPELDGRI